jgi:hypothetical protein
MNFVDDVKLNACFTGAKADFIPQIADVVHAGIGSGVNFDQIQQAAFIDGDTDVAMVAWSFFDRWGQAINSFCQQASHGGLTSAGPERGDVRQPALAH